MAGSEAYPDDGLGVWVGARREYLGDGTDRSAAYTRLHACDWLRRGTSCGAGGDPGSTGDSIRKAPETLYRTMASRSQPARVGSEFQGWRQAIAGEPQCGTRT